MFFRPKTKKKPSTQNLTDERMLARILLKCDCKTINVVKYIAAALEAPETCDYCPYKQHTENCIGLQGCAEAAIKMLEERDGHD